MNLRLIILVITVLFLTNLSFAQSAPCPKDSPDCQDFPLQPGEHVGGFNKGKGFGPKNGHSEKVKGVKLKNPLLGGTGCQQGTVAATLSPDSKVLSLLFDNYIAKAGKSAGVHRDIKTCTVLVPFEVPAGYKFTIVKLDYRGFNSIPANAKTKYVTIYSMFESETNKPVSDRLRRMYQFDGPLTENYIISSDVSSEPLWSPCGKTINFRIDTRAVAVSNQAEEDVMATIDSIDAAANSVDYHLLWQTCTPDTPPNPPGPKPPGPKPPGPGPKPEPPPKPKPPGPMPKPHDSEDNGDHGHNDGHGDHGGGHH